MCTTRNAGQAALHSGFHIVCLPRTVLLWRVPLKTWHEGAERAAPTAAPRQLPGRRGGARAEGPTVRLAQTAQRRGESWRGQDPVPHGDLL